MASTNLGKVAVTSGGNYNASTTYAILTTVVGTNGRAYITKVDNVLGISPGVTSGWENYWVLFAERGIGISTIEKTATAGLVDTYTITYDNGDTETFDVTNGNAATFTIGTTTTGAPGSSASVVNSGTPNAGVFNFTIPAGQGVASGGIQNQVLVKNSGTDYDTKWVGASQLVINDGSVSANTAYSSQKTESTYAKVVRSTSSNVSAGGWSGSAPYTQTVSASGILSSDDADAYPVLSSSLSAAQGEAIMTAWKCVGRIVCNNGSITLYCYSSKPVTDFQVRLKAVR